MGIGWGVSHPNTFPRLGPHQPTCLRLNILQGRQAPGFPFEFSDYLRWRDTHKRGPISLQASAHTKASIKVITQVGGGVEGIKFTFTPLQLDTHAAQVSLKVCSGVWSCACLVGITCHRRVQNRIPRSCQDSAYILFSWNRILPPLSLIGIYFSFYYNLIDKL